MPTCEQPLSRRRFFTRTATAASIAGITAIGFKQIVRESMTAAPGSIDVNMALDFGTLDSAYASQGHAGIESLFHNLDSDQFTITFEWIYERKHVALLDLVVERLSDSRKLVRYASLGLLERLSKPLARTLVPQIVFEVQRIKSRDFKELVLELLRTIEQ